MFYLVYINVGTSYKKVITIQKVITNFSILPQAVLLMSRTKWGPKQNPKIHYLKLWIIKHFTYAHLFVVRGDLKKISAKLGNMSRTRPAAPPNWDV